MRELTFKGYLRQYVNALSYKKTNGLYPLAREASSNNPRLREPLLLYALFSNKSGVLLKATKDKTLLSEYTDILSRYDVLAIEKALINGESFLPERYLRVYKSYLVASNKVQNENHTKLLIINRIKELQKEKNISTYRIYKDLNINHGNLTAFIKHADCTKLSLEKARSTLKYVEAFV